MPITRVDSASSNGTSVGLPAGAADGDLLVVFAYRDSNSAAPGLASGWTNVHTASNGGGASLRVGYKVMAGDTDTGTWSNATHTHVSVFRGFDTTTPIGGTNTNNGDSSTINYPATTLQVTNGSSWVMLSSGHVRPNTQYGAPSGSTLRTSQGTTQPRSINCDTDGGVTSWSSTNTGVSRTEPWVSSVVEIRAFSGQSVDVGQTTETDSTQSVGKTKQKAVGLATETSSAQAVTSISGNQVPVGQAVEQDESNYAVLNHQSEFALPVTWVMEVPSLALPLEFDSSQSLGKAKQKVLGIATEADTAQTAGSAKEKGLGFTAETDAAQAVDHSRALGVAQVTEADQAQPATSAKHKDAGLSTELDTPQEIRPTHVRTLGQAVETDVSLALLQAQQVETGQPSEADAPQQLTSSKRKAIGQAVETDTAQPATINRSLTVGITSETDSAQAVASAKRKDLGLSSETDTANSVTVVGQIEAAIGQVSETDLAQPVTSSKVKELGQATEAGTGQSFASTKQRATGQATEADTAQAIVASSNKFVDVGLVTESDEVLSVTPRRRVGIGQPSESDAAQVVLPARRRTVGQASEAASAQSITVNKHHQIPVRLAIEEDLARTVTEKLYRFEPPTYDRIYNLRGYPRHHIDQGISIIRVDGVLRAFRSPASEQLVGTEGEDFFRGGRVYHVRQGVYDELVTGGFV